MLASVSANARYSPNSTYASEPARGPRAGSESADGRAYSARYISIAPQRKILKCVLLKLGGIRHDAPTTASDLLADAPSKFEISLGLLLARQSESRRKFFLLASRPAGHEPRARHGR